MGFTSTDAVSRSVYLLALLIWPKAFLGDKPFTTLPGAWPQRGSGNGGIMGPGGKWLKHSSGKGES